MEKSWNLISQKGHKPCQPDLMVTTNNALLLGEKPLVPFCRQDNFDQAGLETRDKAIAQVSLEL